MQFKLVNASVNASELSVAVEEVIYRLVKSQLPKAKNPPEAVAVPEVPNEVDSEEPTAVERLSPRSTTRVIVDLAVLSPTVLVKESPITFPSKSWTVVKAVPPVAESTPERTSKPICLSLPRSELPLTEESMRLT